MNRYTARRMKHKGKWLVILDDNTDPLAKFHRCEHYARNADAAIGQINAGVDPWDLASWYHGDGVTNVLTLSADRRPK